MREITPEHFSNLFPRLTWELNKYTPDDVRTNPSVKKEWRVWAPAEPSGWGDTPSEAFWDYIRQKHADTQDQVIAGDQQQKEARAVLERLNKLLEGEP